MAIAVGDFNQDGKPDLAVTTLDSVVVLLGNGDGTFQAGVSYALDSLIDPSAILVGDFNGDGKPDLLVGKSSNAVSILIGNGDGTFQPAVDIPVGKSERGWVAGDFDGDGGLDLAAASVGTNALYVALNAPVVGIYPARLEFGGQAVGVGSAPATVTVSNPSGAPITMAGVTVSGAFTVIDNCPSTLASGTSCALGISFLPTTAGDASGMLTINDSVFGSPQMVKLTGTGVAKPVASPSTSRLMFGKQRVSTTSLPQTFALHNSRKAPLQISSVDATGDFSVTSNCPASLAAGAKCTISVRFTPTAAKILGGTVNISDDAEGSPQSVALSGTGIEPLVGVTPSRVSFADQKAGTTSQGHSITLSNPGSATLKISSIKLAGQHAADFALQNHCGASLPAGKSCGMVAFFTPHATGSRTAILKISTDAAGSPYAVPLAGTGK
jgi:hypothetical protein